MKLLHIKKINNSSEIAYNAAIVIFLSISLYLSWRLNIWIDEAFTLHTTGGTFHDLINRCKNFEYQAPLYYIVLYVWRGLNSSPFAARILSIIFIALSIPIVRGISERYLKNVNSAWAAVIFSLNPYTIWAACEIRLYALSILFSALLMMLFYDAFLKDNSEFRNKILYTAAAAAALYSYYFLGFILLANLCVLVALRKWRQLKQYFLSMVVVSVIFMPQLLVVLDQIRQIHNTAPVETASSISGFSPKILYWRIIEILFPSKYFEFLNIVQRWFFRLFILLSAGFVVVKKAKLNFLYTVAPWVVFGCLFICYLFVLNVLGKEFVESRHLTVIFVPGILSLFTLAALFKKRQIASICIVVFLISYGTALVSKYKPMAKLGDWKRVANFIEKNEARNEPVLVFRAEFILPLKQYYRGINKICPLPKDPDLNNYNIKSQALQNGSEISAILRRNVLNNGQFWIVTRDTGSFRGVNFHAQVLENFLKEKCKTLETGNFYFTKVRLVKLIKTSGYKSILSHSTALGRQAP